LYIDNVDQLSNNQTAWYATWDDSTTTAARGIVTVSSRDTGTIVNNFQVTGAVVVGAGYYKIPVTYINGTLPSNGALLVVSFSRTGDTGANGTSGTTGTSGTSGANGANGTSGTTGTSGTSGANGANGTSGTTGTSGVNGTSGTSGAGGGGSSYFVVTGYAGNSLTLALDHAGDYIRTTSATPVTITVPPQSSVVWVDNTEIMFEQAGAGQITLTTGTGVTINSSESLKTEKQYSVVAIKRTSSNVWTFFGERELV
jgi:hypothetical protein